MIIKRHITIRLPEKASDNLDFIAETNDPKLSLNQAAILSINEKAKRLRNKRDK